MNRWKISWWALVLLVCGRVWAADHAVILLYHHVSEFTPPSTSVTPAQFVKHLEYLDLNDYRVLPLNDLLRDLLAAKPVPDKAVAITFDDAYISVYNEAAPRLRERGWPFTVFLASDPLDQKLGTYMTWEQARDLSRLGGDIGAHSASHAYLLKHLEGESESGWQHRMRREIDYNRERIRDETGVEVKSFAYPFGEYNHRLKAMLAKRGLYGLAQQSGAVGKYSDAQQISRFPLATGYDDMSRFRTAIDSRPLPVVKEHHVQSLLRGRVLNLELAGGAYRPQSLKCYSAAGAPLNTRLNQHGSLLEVELPATHAGRNKVNCTVPAVDAAGEFFWYSYLWMGS